MLTGTYATSTCASCKYWKRWSRFDRAAPASVEPWRWTAPNRMVEDEGVASDGGPRLGECFAARSGDEEADRPYIGGECRSEGISGEVVTNGAFGCVLHQVGSLEDQTHVYILRS